MKDSADRLSALIREKDRLAPGMPCKGIIPDPEICECCCVSCGIHEMAKAVQPREETAWNTISL